MATEPLNPYGILVARHTQLDPGSSEREEGFIIAAVYDSGSSQLLDESVRSDCGQISRWAVWRRAAAQVAAAAGCGLAPLKLSPLVPLGVRTDRPSLCGPPPPPTNTPALQRAYQSE